MKREMVKEIANKALELVGCDMEAECKIDIIFHMAFDAYNNEDFEIACYELWNDDETEIIGIQVEDEVIYW